MERRLGSDDLDSPNRDDRRGRERRVITFADYPENRRQASRRADELGMGDMTKAEFDRACRSLLGSVRRRRIRE
jgi:hypothetical protein